MPKLDSRIKNDPAHAKLFKIYADPPTTTMQRIKAITTGSLPTFVEFSENFSSAKLDEDNFVRQLQVRGFRVLRDFSYKTKISENRLLRINLLVQNVS